MSLIFSEDFSSLTNGDFDTTTGIVDFSGGNFSADIGASNYVEIDSGASDFIVSGTKSIWAKFDATIVGGSVASSRFVTLLSLWATDATDLPLNVALQSDGTGSLVEIVASYRASGATQTITYDTGAAINDNTKHDFEVFYSATDLDKVNGSRIIVYYDGNKVIDTAFTNKNGTAGFNKVRLGSVASNAAVAKTLVIEQLLLSSNRNYVDEAETYHFSPGGDDANLGTEAAPLLSLANMLYHIRGDDSVKITGTSAINPYRSNAQFLGSLKTKRAGTAASPIIIDGQNELCTTNIHIDGTVFKWDNPDGSHDGNPDANGEYRLELLNSDAVATDAEANFIAYATASTWAAQGMPGLTRIWNKGTVGSLAEGEFGYTANTIYYKPLAGQDVNSDVFELGYGSSALSTLDFILLEHDYVTVRNFEVSHFFNSGIAASDGSGRVVESNHCHHGANLGIIVGGAVTVRFNECNNNQKVATGAGGGNGGGITLNSFSGRCEGNYCHDNEDDGIDASGQGTPVGTVTGNLCTGNGYNTTDGNGIEIPINMNVNNNTCADNTKGIHFIGATNASVCRNNIVIDNSLYGISLPTGVGASITFSNNCYSDNGTDIGGAGSGNYSSTDDVAADPLLNSSYSPQSGSPVIGAGIRWWTGAEPIGKDGEPFSDIDTDIGGIQSKLGPFHPVNL